MIEGGYYMKARKIQESEISTAPPHVREIWDLLLMKCNYLDKDKFKKGDCFVSYSQIQEDLSWYVGWRKHSYTRGQCETAMKWLRKKLMITTRKTTRGIIVTVCRYEYYQNAKNYENHKENFTKPTGEPQTCYTILEEREERKKEPNILFIEFWDSYGKKVGAKNKCEKKWLALEDEERQKIIDTLPSFLSSISEKKFVPHPETYLNQRRWEDDIQKEVVSTKPVTTSDIYMREHLRQKKEWEDRNG